MARHVWSLLCNKILTEQGRDSLSFIGAIEGITIASEPPPEGERFNIPVQMSLVTYSIRSNVDVPESGEARFTLVDPDGNEIPPNSIDIEFDNVKTRVILEMDVLPFAGPGWYEFKVEFKGSDSDHYEHWASIPFVVTYAPPPNPAES